MSNNPEDRRAAAAELFGHAAEYYAQRQILLDDIRQTMAIVKETKAEALGKAMEVSQLAAAIAKLVGVKAPQVLAAIQTGAAFEAMETQPPKPVKLGVALPPDYSAPDQPPGILEILRSRGACRYG